MACKLVVTAQFQEVLNNLARRSINLRATKKAHPTAVDWGLGSNSLWIQI